MRTATGENPPAGLVLMIEKPFKSMVILLTFVLMLMASLLLVPLNKLVVR
jgi:hypothetical protein